MSKLNLGNIYQEGDKLSFSVSIKQAILDTFEIEVVRNKYKYPENLSFKFTHNSGSSSSTIIQDSSRLWMHPPRYDYLKILEFTPFPQIKEDDVWRDSVTVGLDMYYGKPLNIEWDGNLTVYSRFALDGSEKLDSHLGQLTIHKVKARSSSKIGYASAVFYFHQYYGLVKSKYLTISEEEIEIELLEFKRDYLKIF